MYLHNKMHAQLNMLITLCAMIKTSKFLSSQIVDIIAMFLKISQFASTTVSEWVEKLVTRLMENKLIIGLTKTQVDKSYESCSILLNKNDFKLVEY
jgi:hypothetical protein